MPPKRRDEGALSGAERSEAVFCLLSLAWDFIGWGYGGCGGAAGPGRRPNLHHSRGGGVAGAPPAAGGIFGWVGAAGCSGGWAGAGAWGRCAGRSRRSSQNAVCAQGKLLAIAASENVRGSVSAAAANGASGAGDHMERPPQTVGLGRFAARITLVQRQGCES